MVATPARPKSAKLLPTAPAGMPYVPPPTPVKGPSLRIPESVTAVGDITGKPYFRFGDRADGQPETVNVSPSPNAAMTTPIAGGHGAVAMDNGGTAIVGGYAPDLTPADFNYTPSGSSSPVSINPYPQQQQPSAAMNGADPLAQQLAARQQVLAAQGQQTTAQQAGLQAQAGVLGATAGTFAPQAGYTNALRGANQVQERATQANAGYIGQQQQDTQQTQAETAGIQAAAQNYADKTAVAQAQNARNNSDYLYGLAGLARPTEVDTANGADSAALPPGVRAKLQTQEQLKTTEATNAQTNRGLSLKLASEAVAMLNNNATQAKEFAAEQGFSLDDAKLMVAKAQNQAGYADLNTQNAGINVSRANQQLTAAGLPPSAGDVIYTDPATGASQWVTPGVKQGYDAQNQRDFNLTQPGDVLYTDPYSGERSYISQSQADQNKIAYNSSLQPYTNAAQSGLDVQYANDPSQAPVQYLLSNMRPNAVGANGMATFESTGPGIFTRQQVINALIAKHYTMQQAVDLTTPTPKSSGTTITPPAFG